MNNKTAHLKYWISIFYLACFAALYLSGDIYKIFSGLMINALAVIAIITAVIILMSFINSASENDRKQIAIYFVSIICMALVSSSYVYARWNFKGDENGNYVGTDYKFEKLAKLCKFCNKPAGKLVCDKCEKELSKKQSKFCFENIEIGDKLKQKLIATIMTVVYKSSKKQQLVVEDDNGMLWVWKHLDNIERA